MNRVFLPSSVRVQPHSSPSCSWLAGARDYHGDHNEAVRDTRRGEQRIQWPGRDPGHNCEAKATTQEFGVSIMCGMLTTHCARREIVNLGGEMCWG
jgi:hypothetical protein